MSVSGPQNVPKISVLICTYNRVELLYGSLESIINQSLAKTLYEVIVVDNASTDRTADLVKEFQNRYAEPDIRLVSESRQGISYARNVGFRNSRGTYVAFMDDDARADKDWLKVMLDCFEHVVPKPLAIGGQIFPFYESPKPSWFKDSYEIRTWGDKPRFLEEGKSFSGSNMAFRREALNVYGPFDVDLGMKGSTLGLGEDTAIFTRMWESNGKADILYYSPQMVVFHWVPRCKTTLTYPLRRAFALGRVQYTYDGTRSIRGSLRYFIKTSFLIVKYCRWALTRRYRRKYNTPQNWIVEGLKPIAIDLGHLAGCLQHLIRGAKR